MSRRYTYARTITTHEGIETFTAHEWDSFDEARTAVEKGIRDRKIQLGTWEPLSAAKSAGASMPTAAPKVQPGEAAPGVPAGRIVPSGNNTAGSK